MRRCCADGVPGLGIRPGEGLEVTGWSTLDELPEEFRLAVVLSDVEELSYKEIADVMDCPVGTVMSRLHRGRRLLQKKLYDHAVLLGIAPVDAPHAMTDRD